jgi:UDP-4-amino-4,6-dideoxy-N-acetyl-beta-L-altrosamine transaminase
MTTSILMAMNNQPFIPYARQSIDSSDMAAVNEALSSTWITRGPHVEAFEKEIADYCEAKYAVAFNSATTALTAACYAAQIGPADRVITTPNSFIASAACGIHFGAMPIFVDIDSSTANLDIDQLAYNANLPSSRGRPILIPVHFAGVPVNMQELDRKLTNPNTVIIEDAAHALGSRYFLNGPKVGSCAWSTMTVFSFHPAKTITTGEGGMVTTNDEELHHRLKLYRNNGIEREAKYLLGEPLPWYYEVHDISGNYNFTEFQAALGRSQLKRISKFIAKRAEGMEIYRDKLQRIPNIRLLTPSFDESVAFHLCVARIDFKKCTISRSELIKKLLAKNIGLQVHYIPLYRHPYLVKKYGETQDYFPKMESYYSEALSLPLYYDLTHQDIDRVVKSLKECLNA